MTCASLSLRAEKSFVWLVPCSDSGISFPVRLRSSATKIMLSMHYEAWFLTQVLLEHRISAANRNAIVSTLNYQVDAINDTLHLLNSRRMMAKKVGSRYGGKMLEVQSWRESLGSHLLIRVDAIVCGLLFRYIYHPDSWSQLDENSEVSRQPDCIWTVMVLQSTMTRVESRD